MINLEYIKKWQKENPDKVREYSKKYYYKNSSPKKRIDKEKSREIKKQAFELNSEWIAKKEIATRLWISYSYVRTILNNSPKKKIPTRYVRIYNPIFHK